MVETLDVREEVLPALVSPRWLVKERAEVLVHESKRNCVRRSWNKSGSCGRSKVGEGEDSYARLVGHPAPLLLDLLLVNINIDSL